MQDEEIKHFLTQNFGLTEFQGLPDAESEYLKHIQLLLSKKIEFMINTDIEKLLQILYRIDVPQGESDAAFDLGEIKKISFKLAERIIARQLQKIDYARKFYNK